MFLASLTGSVIYTNSTTQWQEIHLHALPADREPNTICVSVTEAIRLLEFTIELEDQCLFEALRRGRFKRAKRELGPVLDAIEKQSCPPESGDAALRISAANKTMQHVWPTLPIGRRLTAHVVPLVPPGGFDRNEVRRLLLTFGKVKSVHSIALALHISFVEGEVQ